MQISHSEPLRDKNTLKLQAHAKAFADVASEVELEQALAWAREHQLSVVAMGEGSNVVLAGDVNALVIRQLSGVVQLLSESETTVTVRVAAGKNWHSFVSWSLQQGYYGLENLALIPGTVGAAPIQNIGAYGVELSTFVDTVHCVSTASVQRHSLSNTACEFAYRDSVFKRDSIESMVVTAVDFRLSKQPQLTLDYPALAAELGDRARSAITAQEVFDAVVRVRSSKLPDPAELPNAGSFFKNPVVMATRARSLQDAFPTLPQYPQADGTVKLPAAWMIERCGWKGFREQGVGVHPLHALVLVNYAAQDGGLVLRLAEKIRCSVLEQFAVSLEIEPQIYGRAQ